MTNYLEINKEIYEIKGRIFVISDIHSCFYAFKKLLNKINFNQDDFIIINGDLIDRGGPNNINLIKFISSFKNICLLRGNHEEFYLRADSRELSYSQWHSWGGNNTILELKKASIEDKLLFHNYIVKTNLFAIAKIENKDFFISHNGFNLDMNIIKKNNILLNEETILSQYNENWFNFFVSSDINYIPSTTFKYHWIVGHHPTLRINQKAEIYKRPFYTNIDCGATYEKGRLGILCLNDFSEYYEEIDKKDLRS